MLMSYHMIGLSDLDTGRLGSPQRASYLPDITARAKHRYDLICADGSLRPAQREATARRDEGHFFFEDQISGDDHYVFLSIGKRYWLEPVQVNFGFLFDAEALLKQGAILRKQDLLAHYEDALAEIIEAYAPTRPSSQWSEEEMLKALDEGANDEEYKSPHDAYYQLMDAVRDLRYDLAGVSEIVDQFRKRATQLQSAAQLKGQAALDFLRTSKHAQSGRYELLVHQRLPLSLAVGTIESGQTRLF